MSENNAKEERDWLADTTARVAQLYTQDGIPEWNNQEERTSMSPAIHSMNHKANKESTSNGSMSKSTNGSTSGSGSGASGSGVSGSTVNDYRSDVKQKPKEERKLMKDGYLFMKSTGRLGRAVWHRRWFELDEQCLSYVKGPETLDEV